MLFKPFVALKTFDHLRWKRDRWVFVGDHEDAGRCKKLKRTKIDTIAPSQTQGGAYPEGWIQFSWGRGWDGSKLFDLARKTINGDPAYIFEEHPDLEPLSRRLTATNQIVDRTSRLDVRDLRDLHDCLAPSAECGTSTIRLREQIIAFLPNLGLGDLETLADMARSPMMRTVLPRCA